MPINFFRFLFGFVRFKFVGGFKERFVNSCYSEKLNIKSIKIENDVLIGETDIKTYKKLHTLALKHGGAVKIIKRVGLPFITSAFKNRWGVFAGAIFFIFFVSFMGGFIWDITVTGTDRLSDAQIIDYLSQNGVKIGRRWASIDKENLEFAVLSDFDDVSWISINRLGSTASIEINEAVREPESIELKKITNVVADRDGVITHITALGGTPIVGAGDAVTKGDLLISGIYESEVDGLNHYSHAHGTALAQIEQDITLNISRQQNDKIYTAKKEYKSLYFFGVEIPFYILKDKAESDTVTKWNYFLINSKRLPIATVTREEDYYKIETKTLVDDELEALAKSELEKRKSIQLKDCNILSERVDISTGSDSCLITGSYVYITDIGKETELEVDIDINNKDNNN